ncbi:MAG: YbjN domain-containing protein [Chloroflexota bacterium]
MASDISPATIDSYFGQYEWSYERSGDDVWLTGFRGDISNFRIFVKLTEHWVYFTIAPFVVAPKDEACARRLNWHLLRLNRDINMAKFCLDGDGDVVLTVELPTEGLDYSEFADALGALSHYADDTYLEVLNLAQSPKAASRFDAREDDLDWGEG